MRLLLLSILCLCIPRTVEPVIYLYTDDVARDGALGNQATTTSTCTSLAATIGLVGGNATMLVAYTGRSISQIQSVTLGFPSTTALLDVQSLHLSESAPPVLVEPVQ